MNAIQATGLMALGLVIGSAVLLVLLGVVFFMVNVFIIKTASGFFGFTPDANFVVLTAGILSAASMLGSKK